MSCRSYGGWNDGYDVYLQIRWQAIPEERRGWSVKDGSVPTSLYWGGTSNGTRSRWRSRDQYMKSL